MKDKSFLERNDLAPRDGFEINGREVGQDINNGLNPSLRIVVGKNCTPKMILNAVAHNIRTIMFPRITHENDKVS